MILAFIGVVMTIRNLNSGKPMVNPFVGMLTKTPETDQQGQVKINLCPTRVVKMDLGESLKVYEEKMKWYRGEGEALNIVEVEKWFAHWCTVPAFKLETETIHAFVPYVQIYYVDGTSATLGRAESGGQTIYQWNSQSLLSPELDVALPKFSALPSAKAPGTH